SIACWPAPRAASRSTRVEPLNANPLGRELDPQERLDWLRLSRTETVGPVSFYALLRRFGSARAALDALPKLVRHGDGGRPIAAWPRGEAEREWAALDRIGGCIVCWGEPAYPRALASVEDAPPVL